MPNETEPEATWAYSIEVNAPKTHMRAVATHRTGAVVRSKWWWVDDGSAEAELGERVRAWEAAHLLTVVEDDHAPVP